MLKAWCGQQSAQLRAQCAPRALENLVLRAHRATSEAEAAKGARDEALPQFQGSWRIVGTSLDEDERAPHAFALTGVRWCKSKRAVSIAPLLREALGDVLSAGAAPQTL